MKRYERYKDSGVEWLGEVPEHWEILKGKRLFVKQKRPANVADEIITCFRNGQVTLRSNRRIEGFTNAIKEFGYQGIRKGDLVIHNMDAFAGAIGVSDSDGKSTPVYSACIPIKENFVYPLYYAYLLRSLALNGLITSLAKGIRERSTDFRFDDFGALEFYVPPFGEQQRIVNFIDQKCEQINRAIQQKEKLIILLNERRQIVIQRAVTRGLNPDVKIKASGVEWIGEIPEHWEVKKLKYVCENIQTGTTPSTSNTHFFDGDIDWYTPGDLNNELLFESEKKITQLAISKNEVKLFKGDSILIVGIGGTTGKTSYLQNESTFNQQITGFHSNNESNKFLFHQLRSYSKLFLRIANYTTLPILNNDFFKSFILPVPPISEQQQIVDYLDTVNKKIDTAISFKKQEIEKLKEYKATLINSAVTGKIKID